MEKTKKYINTLSNAIDVIIQDAKRNEHGITFVEVEKVVNGLDIADVISEEPDNTQEKWMEVSGNTPDELKARWDGGKGMVAEYIKASEQRADEHFSRYGKRPQPTHLKETTEAIDRALQRLLKWQEGHEKEAEGQTTTPTARREQKRFSVNISKARAATILERLKADGYIARETMLADWLSALGIDNNEFKKIRWTKKQSRNKDKVSAASLIDFLCCLKLNMNKIKDAVGDVFLPKITPDSFTQFQKKYTSEYHEELKNLIS
ncbi:MAG: hypothetical protein IJ607_10670 [Bacteroidaceae bacterium]|nr:hypothetical protein [Bacteroidaceae bacterium]